MKHSKQLFGILFISIVIISSCKKDDQFISLQVYTNGITDITINSVKVEGKIVISGKADISEVGFCWSLKNNASINDSKIKSLDAIGNYKDEERIYNLTLDSLIPNQTYYVRSYAIYNGYLVYGNEKIFKTAQDSTPFWSFGENEKVVDFNALYDSTNNALIFNDKNGNLVALQFAGGLQAPKTYAVVATTLELVEGQAQVAQFVYNAQFWKSVGGNGEKIYTELIDGEIVVKFNNLLLESNTEPKLQNRLSGLVKIKL
jgi:hypothetical protein